MTTLRVYLSPKSLLRNSFRYERRGRATCILRKWLQSGARRTIDAPTHKSQSAWISIKSGATHPAVQEKMARMKRIRREVIWINKCHGSGYPTWGPVSSASVEIRFKIEFEEIIKGIVQAKNKNRIIWSLSGRSRQTNKKSVKNRFFLKLTSLIYSAKLEINCFYLVNCPTKHRMPTKNKKIKIIKGASANYYRSKCKFFFIFTLICC